MVTDGEIPLFFTASNSIGHNMLGFLKKLFSNKDAWHANYVSGLTTVAQLAVAMGAMNYLQTSKGCSADDVLELSTAWANYLLGKAPSQQHAHLDLPSEQMRALKWLAGAGADFENLVVQGLRLNMTVTHIRTGNIDNNCLAVLEQIGQEQPEAPDIDKYEAMLMLVMASKLSAEQWRSLDNFIVTGPYAPYFKASKLFGRG